MTSKTLLFVLCLALTPLAAQGPGPGGGGGPGPGGGGGPGPLPPLPPVPVPAQNPQTPAKILLGKILFWDEQLSSEGNVACGTCHLPEFGGGDPRPAQHPGFDGTFGTADDGFTSVGVIRSDANNRFVRDAVFGLRPQTTRRAPPTMINAAYAPRLFWDGRAGPAFFSPTNGNLLINGGAALEEQATNPALGVDEMAHQDRDWADIVNKLAVVRPLVLATNLPTDIGARLASEPSYTDLFQDAFGTPAITPVRFAMALAAYQRTLIADQTPWDAFNAGDPNALTALEQQGLQVFATTGRCGVCHTPPFFTGHGFRNVGLRPVTEDEGRFEVTGNAADRGRFKVPTLRNVALRPRFMHNGEFTTLQQVVAFYAQHGRFAFNQDPAISQIAVNPQQATALVAFLTGGLTDPRVAQGLPPFDRPTLWSEGPRNPILGAAPGGPRMLAPTPSNLANPDFRLGLARVPGGAPAVLAVSLQPSAAGSMLGDMPLIIDPLDPFLMLFEEVTDGTGPNGGYATAQLPLPDAPAAAGISFWAQWFVAAPGANAQGVIASPGTEMTLF